MIMQLPNEGCCASARWRARSAAACGRPHLRVRIVPFPRRAGQAEAQEMQAEAAILKKDAIEKFVSRGDAPRETVFAAPSPPQARISLSAISQRGVVVLRRFR